MSPKIQICVFIIMAATTVVLAGSLSPRGSAKQPRNRYIALASKCTDNINMETFFFRIYFLHARLASSLKKQSSFLVSV